VLALTTFDDDEVLAAMLRAGASGFILKGVTAEDLQRAVRVVAEGGAWLDPAVTGRVLKVYRSATPQAPADDAGLDALSGREREVLALIGQGKTNAEIAAELVLGEGTVKTHINHVFAKLRLRDRAAAVVYAFDHDLVTPKSGRLWFAAVGMRQAGGVGRSEAEVEFAAELRMFLAPRHRNGSARAACDGVSSLGHVVESLGVPLPETGVLTVNGEPIAPSYRLAAGDSVYVGAIRRPQPVPTPRFLLDVHLGTLARRLRLVGVDTAYTNDADDDALIEDANATRRVLLTQDRGLLRRRALWLGAYVRGALPDDQLRDVLDRFAPPLAPWTRCTACNGPLAPVRKADVDPLLPPGTRRTYQAFARCRTCGQVYWRGAHSQRLQRVVDSALDTVAAASN